MYDVIVIGAGVAGAATARELARYDCRVLVLERSDDIASGTTRANSGIVHGGYDPLPGTLKARFNKEACDAFPALADELGFSYVNNGSLVVAFQDGEIPTLEELLARGLANGIEGLEIIDADVLHEKEPRLSPDAVAALWVPTGGIVDPYGLTLAFAENAAVNGVEFVFDALVCTIERTEEGFRVQAGDTSYETRVVVNAAGTHVGDIDAMLGLSPVRILPRAGEYCLFDTDFGKHFTSTIFQTPTTAGKGVLVTPTTGGNLLVGPDAVLRDDPDDTSTDAQGLEAILETAKRTWPELSRSGIITNFAGVRATGTTGDFIIGPVDGVPGYERIAAFESPGLSAAPAVGAFVARSVASYLGLEQNPSFVSHRDKPFCFATASDEERNAKIAEDSRFGHMVCRCEKVTEGEVVAAIHSPVPARSVDAVKWRTRAGMGRCQSGFCLPPTADLLVSELGLSWNAVSKHGKGSELLDGKAEVV